MKSFLSTFFFFFSPIFMPSRDSAGKQLIKKVNYFLYNMAILVYYLYKIWLYGYLVNRYLNNVNG